MSRQSSATDHCDIIDVLEESVTTGGPVTIALRSGENFSDHVRDVVTAQGQDYAEFQTHGRLPVDDIRAASRGEPQ